MYQYRKKTRNRIIRKCAGVFLHYCRLTFTMFAIFVDRKEKNKMRYGYDLNNPIERDMFFKKHQRNLQRMFNSDKKTSLNFAEVIKEIQEELNYFMQREKQEQEIEKRIQEETNKRVEQQIEKELPNIIEKELSKLFK